MLEDVRWQWLAFDELDTNTLYQILALREDVFIVEQKCPYHDVDFRDQRAMHYLGWLDTAAGKKLIAYCRVLTLDNEPALSIGRVATAEIARGKGVGRMMIKQALDYMQHEYREQHPEYKDYPVIISAQLYLKKFYEDYGFIAEGEPYDEDWIPHISMVLS